MQPSVKILDPARDYPILFNRVNMNRVYAAHEQKFESLSRPKNLLVTVAATRAAALP
jgi:hypothetical protein